MKNTARVRRRRRNRDPAIVPVLPVPDELVQWEVLVRLPAKELLRCRAACRSWRRLTSDAAFLVAHRRRQPSLPLVLLHGDTDNVLSATVDAFDVRQSPAVRRPVLGFYGYNEYHKCSIHASFDGLLLLSFITYGCRCFYICNPATRQWCELPDLTGGNVAALYPHLPSGEYRVLYRKHPNNNCYYVLTLASSRGQRCIGLPVPSPSMKNLMTEVMPTSEHSPVLLHDCLHWYSGSSSDVQSKVIVFDTVGESFRCMQSPIAAGNATHLLHTDGTLTIHHLDYVTMIVQVWALQDYEMEVWSWSLNYRTELPVVEMTKYVSETSFVGWEVVPENGDMLVHGFFPWCMFHCDSKGKLVDKFQQDGVVAGARGLCFRESLVRHVFFQRKDGNRKWLPRFFRGL